MKLLYIALIALAFAACSGGEKAEEAAPAEETTVAPAEEAPAAPAEEMPADTTAPAEGEGEHAEGDGHSH